MELYENIENDKKLCFVVVAWKLFQVFHKALFTHVKGCICVCLCAYLFVKLVKYLMN